MERSIKKLSYVTRFEVSTSLATNGKYVAKGIVVTGPNQGQYITVDSDNKETAISQFLAKAEEVYEHARRRSTV